MVSKCCAPECCNASYNKTPEITFHRFPKNENIRNAWVRNLNRKDWQPNATSILCSKHFKANFICQREHRTILKPNAIPTIFNKAELPEEVSQSSSSYKHVSTATKGPNTVSKKKSDSELKIANDSSSDKDVYLEIDTEIKNEAADDSSSDEDTGTDCEPRWQSSGKLGTEDDNYPYEFLCNVCNQAIVGFRYTCVQCLDVDLCDACEARQAHHMHYVLRIPELRPPEEVSEVLKQVRSQLALVLPGGARVDDEPEVIVKSEIKEELLDDPLEVAVEPDSRPHATNVLEQALLSIDLPGPARTHVPVSEQTHHTTGTSTRQPRRPIKRRLSPDKHEPPSATQMQKHDSEAKTSAPHTKTVILHKLTSASHIKTAVSYTPVKYSHTQTSTSGTQTQHLHKILTQAKPDPGATAAGDVSPQASSSGSKGSRVLKRKNTVKLAEVKRKHDKCSKSMDSAPDSAVETVTENSEPTSFDDETALADTITFRSNTIFQNNIEIDFIEEEDDVAEILEDLEQKKKNRKKMLNKELRMKGEAYLGYRRERDTNTNLKLKIHHDVIRPARSIKPACNSLFCKKSKLRNCDNINENKRKELFTLFWKTMSWEQRKIFICCHVTALDKKVTKSTESKRSKTLAYFLTIENVRHQVCKMMFLNTFGIKEWFVRYWLENKQRDASTF